ncbi:hypothetical protein [Staphylococcus equorum]|nr:hypothetical protein [Staphylococcus equorum]
MSKEYEHLSIQERWRIDGELDAKYYEKITEQEINDFKKKIEESKKDKD